MSKLAERRAKVEQEYIKLGNALNKTALARELGVSSMTITRDLSYISDVWAASKTDLDEERKRTLAAYDAAAAEAWEQYEYVVSAVKPHHNAAIGYLRTYLEAHRARTKLLGLDAPTKVETSGITRFIIEHKDDSLAQPVPTTARNHLPSSTLQDSGDGAQVWQDDDGSIPH